MFSVEKKENSEILLRQKSWREMRGRIRFRERRCQRSDAECRSTSEQKPELKTDNVAWLRGEGLALNVTGGADGGGLGRRAGSAGESVLRTLRFVSAPRSYSDPAHSGWTLDSGGCHRCTSA